jgi:hypothetical protein
VARKNVYGPSMTLMAASAPNLAAGTPTSIPSKTANQGRQTSTIIGTLMANQSLPIRSFRAFDGGKVAK